MHCPKLPKQSTAQIHYWTTTRTIECSKYSKTIKIIKSGEYIFHTLTKELKPLITLLKIYQNDQQR